jgi:acyl-coenzyme A synthetase/AMP-(fatty) acid ligase
MRMQQSNRSEWASLRNALRARGEFHDCVIADDEAEITQSDLIAGSALYGRGSELRGRSVLVATASQLTTASALIELDGLARRLIICPPDFSLQHLPFVMEAAGVDAIVSDRPMQHFGQARSILFCPCSKAIAPGRGDGEVNYETEWVLLTSGTTGVPKLVAHSLASLAGAIGPAESLGRRVVWSTFYDIRRYGGLQILLRCVLTGASLVLSSSREPTANFLARAAAHGVTHISGTPSQWRKVLMSAAARVIAPEYVRLSGEIADQAILNHLGAVYPKARIVHAFASTEAGVAFEVRDGCTGFSASTLEEAAEVEMKVECGSLRIRSSRNASRYLGRNAPALKDEDGFVDTGDMLEQREGRYYFIGRRDGTINVGGLKVHPEEVEAVINRHPAVQTSLVRTKKNPITGSLVIADVVLQRDPQPTRCNARSIQDDILLLCRESLSSYKVPAAINFIPTLTVAESGKVLRRNA